MKRLWFKRKTHGWGWYPVTWQGWVVTLSYLAFVVISAYTVDEHSPTQKVIVMFILPVTLLTIIFIRIAYMTGERPRWQWGKKKGR